jgi:hypothetical protein
MSRGSSRGSSRCSSSTTSATPRVQVPRLVMRLVAPLVVDYFDYAARLGAPARRAARLVTCRRQLRLCRVRVPRHVARLVLPRVVVNFDYAARPGSSARHAARHAARRAARRRLLRLRRASGCLGTSRGITRLVTPLVVNYSASRRLVVNNSASRRLIVDYFASAVCPVASARRAARHAARLATCSRQLRLRRASGFLGKSRGSSRRSSSTTSPSPRVRVPQPVARLVVDYFAYAARPSASARRAAHHAARLVVDYFANAARPGASARHAARHTACRRLLRALRLRHAATLALLQPRCASQQHWLYINYTARRRDVVFWSHRVDHSSRLVFQTSRNNNHSPNNWSESTLTSQLQQQPSRLHRRPQRLHQQSAQAATAKSFI